MWFTRGNIVLSLIFIGGIPTAMPTVLSVTQLGAITKKMTAIEEMAGMDVLCSDKTGTLTLNKLTVDKTIIEVSAKGVDMVVLMAARASRLENQDQDAIDAAIVAMLADPKEVVWEPYAAVMDDLPDYCKVGREIWRDRVPLICVDIVDRHYLDRAMRQFGKRQDVPGNRYPNDYTLHNLSRWGHARMDWSAKHAPYVVQWDQRLQSVVQGIDHNGVDTVTSEYITWYVRITRRWIGSVMRSPPERGVQRDAGLIELMHQGIGAHYGMFRDSSHAEGIVSCQQLSTQLGFDLPMGTMFNQRCQAVPGQAAAAAEAPGVPPQRRRRRAVVAPPPVDAAEAPHVPPVSAHPTQQTPPSHQTPIEQGTLPTPMYPYDNMYISGPIYSPPPHTHMYSGGPMFSLGGYMTPPYMG